MTRAVWLTDIHLNFLGFVQINRFIRTVQAQNPDVILISGDIGEARTVGWYLKTLEQKLQRPIYFVLGNHDFYMGAVQDVRAAVRKLSDESNRLCWLNEAEVVELAPGVGLVGHDSWADGRYGSYEASPMMLNDFVVIYDLAGMSKAERLKKLNELGDEAANHFCRVLPEAFERCQQVVLLTHVPPFIETCWHEGRMADDDSLPFFACKAVGDVLREIMSARPNCQLTVLCGHTHGPCDVQIAPNLHVLAGSAEYGKPVIQQVFTF